MKWLLARLGFVPRAEVLLAEWRGYRTGVAHGYLEAQRQDKKFIFAEVERIRAERLH